MSADIVKISCPIVKQPDGRYLTYIMRDGEVVDKVPTPRSQIRRERISCLWKPEVRDTSTSYIQMNKSFINELEMEAEM